eukprot:95103_1
MSFGIPYKISSPASCPYAIAGIRFHHLLHACEWIYMVVYHMFVYDKCVFVSIIYSSCCILLPFRVDFIEIVIDLFLIPCSPSWVAGDKFNKPSSLLSLVPFRH